MQKILFSKSEEETKYFAKSIASTLKSGSIIALYGELGVGKTIFVKGLIPALSEYKESVVSSPTFTYLHVFESTPPIYHFDLYRIKTAQAFLEMGFSDYFDHQGICLIEWPECIRTFLPSHTIHIEILYLEEGERQINVR